MRAHVPWWWLLLLFTDGFVTSQTRRAPQLARKSKSIPQDGVDHETAGRDLYAGSKHRCPPKTSAWRHEGKAYTAEPTHTTLQWFDDDITPILRLEGLENVTSDLLVDKRDGSNVISRKCRHRDTLVSTDSSAQRLGNFYRHCWARRAVTIDDRGHLIAYANNIRPHVPPQKQLHSLAFLVQFSCRAARGRSWVRYSAAVIVTDPVEDFIEGPTYDPIGALVAGLRGVYGIPINGDGLAYGFPIGDPTGVQSRNIELFEPACSLVNANPKAFCRALSDYSQVPSVTIAPYNCNFDYTAAQPFVETSQTLGQDNMGRKLPQPLRFYPNDSTPDFIDQDTMLAERSTYAWLYDKVLQLYQYVPCDNGETPFPLDAKFAPDFGPSTRINLYEPDEASGVFNSNTNYTTTVLGLSSVGTDGDGHHTYVLVLRGTESRTEWLADYVTNQTRVDLDNPFFPGAQIFTGFLYIFQQVIGDILGDAEIQTQKSTNITRILVSGHSLGSGIGQLAALALAVTYPAIQVDYVGFGAPTVGDDLFASMLNEKVNFRSVQFSRSGPSASPYRGAGDAIAQTNCPHNPTCYESVVPTQEFSTIRLHSSYTKPRGNVLFTAEDMPDAEYGLPADATRVNYFTLQQLDTYDYNAAHTCSYTCWAAQDISQSYPYDSCYFAWQSTALPADIQTFGVCATLFDTQPLPPVRQ